MINLKRFTCCVAATLFCLITFTLKAQVDNRQSFFKIDKTDLGIGLGTTFYLGDYNQSLPFKNAMYYGSIFHRYSFNMLYALRTSVTLGKVAGGTNSRKMQLPFYSDRYSDPVLYPDGRDVKFERTFVDFNTGIEIGLKPFDPITHRLKTTFAPYIFIGLGVAIGYPDKYYDTQDSRSASFRYPSVYGTVDENSGSIQIFNIPLALGFKWSPAQLWTIGAEWQFKKTFKDNIDRFDNTEGQSKLMNSDWISTFGVSVSYRLMPKKKCPAIETYTPPKRSLKGINRDQTRANRATKKKK